MIECVRFNEYQKGCLLGFADFKVPNFCIPGCDVQINGCSLYSKDNHRWVNLPSKEYTNTEGLKKFSPFLRFDKEEHYKKFCEAMKNAIDRYIADNPPQERSAPLPAKEEVMSSGFTEENEVPF